MQPPQPFVRLVRTVSICSLVSMLASCAGHQAPPQTPPPSSTSTEENGITWITPYGKPTRPFTPAVRFGNLLFLSGQIGTTPNAAGGVVPGGIQAETRQTMMNIKDVLEKSGTSLERVLKCTIMMADMREWDAMNEVYASFFPRNKPARSALGANGLALGARVEIECIAAVP